MLASDLSPYGVKLLNSLYLLSFLVYFIIVPGISRPDETTRITAEIKNDLRKVQELAKQEDHSGLASLYLTIGNKYLILKNKDSAQSYLIRAIYEAEMVSSEEVIVKATPQLIDIFQGKNDDSLIGSDIYSRRSILLQKRLLKVLRSSSPLHIQKLWYKLGNLYETSGQYQLARESLWKAYQITHNHYQDSCCFKIASVYEKMQKTDSALYYYRDALRLSQEKKNTPVAILSLMALGDLHVTLRQWESARIFYHEGIELVSKKNDSSGLALFHARIGKAWHQEGVFDKASPWLQKAIPVLIATGHYPEAAMCKQLLAEENWHHGSKQSAMLLLKEAERLATDFYNIEFRQNLFNIQINWYLEEGKYQNALFHQKRLTRFLDSLRQLRLNKVSYELKNDTKDKELQKLRTLSIMLRSDAYKRKLIEFGLIGLACAVVITMLITYGSWGSRMRINKQLQMQNNLIRQQKKEMQSSLEALDKTRTQMIESEKMASLGQAAAGIIQELGEPLSHIAMNMPTVEVTLSGLVSMVEACDSVNKETIKEYKEDIELMNGSIRNGISRSTKILDGLRTFSTLAFDETQVEFVEKSIEFVLELQKKKLAKNKVTVQFNRSQSSKQVKGNSSQLMQVWINLIDNAIYALERQADNKLISISVKYTDSHVIVAVKDNGEGIPEEIQSRILEPFFTTKPVGIGTGLGLSITFGIIQKHGGNITLSSKPGEGTCFEIELPLHAENDHD